MWSFYRESTFHWQEVRGKRPGLICSEQDRLRGAGEIPVHIAIIMDGNGRWAKQRGLPRIAGHREGVESVRDSVEACGQLGVQYLTLYAFSTENWKRPQDEVSLLMRLLLTALRDETDRLHTNNVRLRTIGDIDALPAEVQAELNEAGNTDSREHGSDADPCAQLQRPVGDHPGGARHRP